jgi:hypothetical protein
MPSFDIILHHHKNAVIYYHRLHAAAAAARHCTSAGKKPIMGNKKKAAEHVRTMHGARPALLLTRPQSPANICRAPRTTRRRVIRRACSTGSQVAAPKTAERAVLFAPVFWHGIGVKYASLSRSTTRQGGIAFWRKKEKNSKQTLFSIFFFSSLSAHVYIHTLRCKCHCKCL